VVSSVRTSAGRSRAIGQNSSQSTHPVEVLVGHTDGMERRLKPSLGAPPRAPALVDLCEIGSVQAIPVRVGGEVGLQSTVLGREGHRPGEVRRRDHAGAAVIQIDVEQTSSARSALAMEHQGGE